MTGEFNYTTNDIQVSLNWGDMAGTGPYNPADGIFIYLENDDNPDYVHRVITADAAREMGEALLTAADEHDRLAAEHKVEPYKPKLPTEPGVYVGGMGVYYERNTLNDYVLVELTHGGKWKQVNQTTKKLGVSAKSWAERQVNMNITMRKLVEEEK